MGEVEIVESGSLNSLTTGWENYGERTRIMLLGARADRHALRNHGRTIAIEETAVSVFYRPREERAEMEACGINHSAASFQFVDLAMADLGRWMQPLIGQGWSRGEVAIVAAGDASFESESWMCFHHPAIPIPSEIPLSESPASISRKAFVTHPGPVLDSISESDMDAIVASMASDIAAAADEDGHDEVDSRDVEQGVDEQVSEPTPQNQEEELPVIEQKEESPLEAELRQVISLLVAGGQEMGDIMEHPQFIEVSERASAAGVDVWGMFVRLSDDS
ncbi:MAG TPA: hypothetical protein D7I10_06095 [Candidatus Poseidoniales archaeon]|nr:MAG TPA: hypothetical protein D7I10_06095 [Candidatus Poseidoniales archaeon]HIH81984.1 hypothetical protein [Candidatus Thalassarchaeaceae archaeon]